MTIAAIAPHPKFMCDIADVASLPTGTANGISEGSEAYAVDSAHGVIIKYLYHNGAWYKSPNSFQSAATFFTSSASSTTTLTCAALADVAGQYVGQMALPMEGAMQGEGRYIVAYNGTNLITVAPAWAADPGGAIAFAVVSSPLDIVTRALGTDGSTVTDSATTVLGALGADNADNAFSSASVVANADGSTLEREEYIQSVLDAVKVATINLNQAAASYDLFTGTTQVVDLEKLVIQMPVGAAGGALTGITIQTNDATPQALIIAAQGVVANLTSENQLTWEGICRIGVGKKIQLTIVGGATGGSYICIVNAHYKPAVSGGTLA